MLVRGLRGATAVMLLCAPAGAAGTASAGAPCHTLSDPSGDAWSVRPSPADDLIWVDVAATTRTLTVTVRPAGLDYGTPLLGHVYEVVLDNGERQSSLVATLDTGRGSYRLFQGGSAGGAATVSGAAGAIDGQVDTDRGVVVMRVALARVGFAFGSWVRVRSVVYQNVTTANAAPELPDHPFSRYGTDTSDTNPLVQLGRRCSGRT